MEKQWKITKEQIIVPGDPGGGRTGAEPVEASDETGNLRNRRIISKKTVEKSKKILYYIISLCRLFLRRYSLRRNYRMISAGDFRNGVTLEIDGQVVQILEFQHVKPGKGAAFVRTKLKNVINGGVVERTFRPTEKFPQARIERVDMQYLYTDGDLFYFMNVENYEQIALNQDTIGDALKFVKENEMVKVCSYNGSVFAVEPPLFVELEITDTEPGFKGDTAQGATKPATVETGANVQVPLFVNQGDVIKIDTRTGEYLSRV